MLKLFRAGFSFCVIVRQMVHGIWAFTKVRNQRADGPRGCSLFVSSDDENSISARSPRGTNEWQKKSLSFCGIFFRRLFFHFPVPKTNSEASTICHPNLSVVVFFFVGASEADHPCDNCENINFYLMCLPIDSRTASDRYRFNSFEIFSPTQTHTQSARR